MAGMHFIILKVNGVDVSQMSHEDAVQMFLKASEPILVEVRRRSYKVDSNVNESAECTDRIDSNDASNQRDNLCSRRQSPTMSQLTSPAKNQKLLCDHPTPQAASVDSLKFHSLYISSSQNSVGLDSSKKMIRGDHHANSSGSLQIATHRNNNNSASTSLNSTSIKQIPNVDETTNQAITTAQSRSASISSATSPSKSVHLQSATSSPFKETIRRPTDDDVTPNSNNKGSTSIGIQTDNFTTDFIFSGSSMLNTEQIIGNEHNLFSECIAPDIDIEEITLRKSDSNERLGLTVCYSSGGGNGSGSDDTDTCTEVYISDIVPDSIAGRDGRLRQGDQILQVNGKDVSNKEETETLIAENNNAVTLLVSRYLYGDDDEFNEQGDFFDDDEPNMEYANCFLGNYIFSESAKSSHVTSPEKKLSPEDLPPTQNELTRAIIPDIIVPSTELTTAATTSKDPLNHHNIRAHLEQVNQEIAILDSRVENMMSQHAKPSKVVESKQKETTSSVTQVMDYDTEHIYETIPEDFESEPFYCSPYESSEHQTRIEQWLGMQEASDVNETNKLRALQQKQQQQNLKQNNENLSIWTKAKNGTVHSTNSSAGDDHENSSSAYNTGGSCNSNTMTPLTLELNANYRDREQHFSSTLILCPSKHSVTPLNEVTTQQRLSNQSNQESIEAAKISSHRYSKEKLPSPTHSSKVSQSVPNKQKSLAVLPHKIVDVTKSNAQSTPPISATNTMYTNVANLQQTMLLQQQLFRQALIHQRVPSSSVPCPQFTAPNLSQYHFVSSQEVSTVKLNTHPNEEHMVWKVKRRQDGTRYIVRRPARNRFLRNRALRISAERNDQTTEDDTISEIKTGRYWTKEERKKHIERAREKRQRQQIIITKKNNEIAPSANNCAVQASNQAKGADTMQPNVEFFQQKQAISQPKLSPSLNTLNTAAAAAAATATVYRQNTLTGQCFTKKLTKKNSNSPVEVNTSASAATNTTNVVGTGTIKSTPTSSGSKMPHGSVPVSTYHSRIAHPSS